MSPSAVGRGTNNVTAGAEGRNEPELSWRQLRSVSPLARSLFLLQLTGRELRLGLHNTSKQALLVLLLFRARPCFLQEFLFAQVLQHPFQAFLWVSGEARPELC